jgi:hypothetical protein
MLVAVAAIPPARSAALKLLGFGSARIVRVPTLPHVPATPRSRLGRSLPLAEATRAVGFRVRVPRALAAPVDTRYSEAIAAGAVTLVYPTASGLPPTAPDGSIGLLLTEFRGASTPYLNKIVTPGTRVRGVAIGGHRGAWLTGAVHVLVARDRRALISTGRPILVHANVLLWEQDGLAFRIETRASLAKALRVARSIR